MTQRSMNGLGSSDIFAVFVKSRRESFGCALGGCCGAAELLEKILIKLKI